MINHIMMVQNVLLATVQLIMIQAQNHVWNALIIEFLTSNHNSANAIQAYTSQVQVV